MKKFNQPNIATNITIKELYRPTTANQSIKQYP